MVLSPQPNKPFSGKFSPKKSRRMKQTSSVHLRQVNAQFRLARLPGGLRSRVAFSVTVAPHVSKKNWQQTPNPGNDLQYFRSDSPRWLFKGKSIFSTEPVRYRPLAQQPCTL